ncbi:MAG TPA: dihydroneopterin aldolase [Chloroflexi bacterium]|jgi:FolB domain-containing protein|nr:dihydroneopterin aldolase [Chloroflexota bacterium]
MTDRIIIRDLLLRGIIGINPDEQDSPQDILISLTLHTDIRAAAASDDIADTADYSAMVRRIQALVESSRFGLVERLAEEIATLCLRDAHVNAVTVRVEKPQVIRQARAVGVEIYRSREG